MKINESKLREIVTKCVEKVVSEGWQDDMYSDIDELNAIENEARKLQEFVETTAFENSPIIQHTMAIIEYCQAQKKNVMG